jgi:hypothetical protein
MSNGKQFDPELAALAVNRRDASIISNRIAVLTAALGGAIHHLANDDRAGAIKQLEDALQMQKDLGREIDERLNIWSEGGDDR